jgi:hypothetical protein
MDEETFVSVFTPYVAFQAEGARVAITSCKKCGAAILISPPDVIDTMDTHLTWHADQERKET